MPENCENRFGLVNRCISYARQTPEIDHVLRYAVDLPNSFLVDLTKPY